MNNHREGAFLPPVLGELNYSDWKIRMKMFIKSIDEWAWRAILIGWTPPTSMNESHEIIQTPKEKWSDEEVRIADYNSKATNAILSCIDEDQFKLISMCKSAKEAWDVLQEAYEGTTLISECKETVAETVTTVGQTVHTELRYDKLHSIPDKRLTPLNVAGDDGDSENSSDDDVSSLEELKECYERMYEKFLQVCESNKFLEKEKLVLIEENKVLKVRISTLEQNAISASRETDSLKAKFAQTQDAISKFNTGRVNLNEILKTNQPNYGHLGVRGNKLSDDSLKQKEDPIGKINFVKQCTVSQTVATVAPKQSFQRKRFVPICHFCHVAGHIRPRCFKYLKMVKRMMARSPLSAKIDHTFVSSQKPKIKVDLVNKTQQKIWVKKSDLNCLSAITSLKSCDDSTNCSNSSVDKIRLGHKKLDLLNFDNLSAKNNSMNPIQHARTKLTDICHCCIRGLVEKGVVSIDYAATENELTDVFAKTLDAQRFDSLRKSLGIYVA